MDKTLYLLDGYSVIYRSYFALIRSPLRNPQGQNASAVFGFFRTVFSIFQEYQPHYFAVALDSHGPTFRHEQYPLYKANREKAPDDLHQQVPVIEEILERMAIPAIRVNGFEADDIMATLARRCADEGRPCRVITGDKDMLQLVGRGVTVLKPGKGRLETMDHAAVETEWGVAPDQILDYLSLTGDSADNVPGVKGIGAKTAAELLQKYRTLEGIYENLDGVSGTSKRTKLEEGHQNALLSRELITLRFDVPLSASPEDLLVTGPDYAAAAPLLAAQGAHTLLRDMGVAPAVGAAPGGANSSEEGGPGGANSSGEGGPGDLGALFAPGAVNRAAPGAVSGPSGPAAGGAAPAPGAVSGRSGPAAGGAAPAPPGYTPPPPPEYAAPGDYTAILSTDDLDRWIAKAREAGTVAFDCETDNLDAMRARPVGFSLSCEWGIACYIPLRGPDGIVLDEDAVRDRLGPLLEDASIRIVGQNIKYDYKVLSRWGVTIANLWFDTMIAAWLVNSAGAGYGMDALAERYLGYRTVHFADVVGGKDGRFEDVPVDAATRYAAEDADITFRLYRVLEPLLVRRGVQELFTGTEMPLVPILANMEMVGIGLDADELAAYSVELSASIKTIAADIYRLAGREFNIGSTKQLQEVLFTERKLQPVKKTKTGFSTDNSVLQILAREDPIPEQVLRYRQLTKLLSTYVESLPRLIHPETGRIHTHYNQTGTATGRLSSTDPNLQNIPVRDEEGRRIRHAFVSSPGRTFVSADYAQVELVVLAHLSGDEALSTSFRNGEDVHKRTASLLFGIEPDEVTSDLRRIAKTINFGVMYGMSAFRLSNELNIPRGEASEFINAYFGTYKKIREFIDMTVAEAERTGEVRTILGRPRPIPEINSRNKTVKSASERIAVNTPIQGSAADIVKRAMIAISARLDAEKLSSKLILQVHDELILECPEDEIQTVKAILAEEMSQAVALTIPLQVSVETGNHWGMMHA